MLTYCGSRLRVVFDNLWKIIALFLLTSVTGQEILTRDPIGMLNQKKYAVFSTNQKQTKTTRHLANACFPALSTD